MSRIQLECPDLTDVRLRQEPDDEEDEEEEDGGAGEGDEDDDEDDGILGMSPLKHTPK